MKKFICVLALAFAIATSFTACTDENVTPQTNEGGSSGGSIDPKAN